MRLGEHDGLLAGGAVHQAGTRQLDGPRHQLRPALVGVGWWANAARCRFGRSKRRDHLAGSRSSEPVDDVGPDRWGRGGGERGDRGVAEPLDHRPSRR